MHSQDWRTILCIMSLGRFHLYRSVPEVLSAWTDMYNHNPQRCNTIILTVLPIAFDLKHVNDILNLLSLLE